MSKLRLSYYSECESFSLEIRRPAGGEFLVPMTEVLTKTKRGNVIQNVGPSEAIDDSIEAQLKSQVDLTMNSLRGGI